MVMCVDDQQDQGGQSHGENHRFKKYIQGISDAVFVWKRNYGECGQKESRDKTTEYEVNNMEYLRETKIYDQTIHFDKVIQPDQLQNGHNQDEADLINEKGFGVEVPINECIRLVEKDSKTDQKIKEEYVSDKRAQEFRPQPGRVSHQPVKRGCPENHSGEIDDFGQKLHEGPFKHSPYAKSRIQHVGFEIPESWRYP